MNTPTIRLALRRFARFIHLWLGLITGLFICLMGFSGGLVALRPPLAVWMAPSARTTNCVPVDWARAAREVSATTGTEINRIYGPLENDTRWHFRMATDQPIIFRHVIYDGCAAKVLGTVNLGWMDWTVDLHHNLLNGRLGRTWAGFIGILMLISGISGLFVWLLARPSLVTALSINVPFTPATPRQLHRAFGIVAAILLGLEAWTGIWLCFPQTMRSVTSSVLPFAAPLRRPRPPRDSSATRAGLAEIMAAANAAIPGGKIREMRMPEGDGPVQVRMWAPGDFRFLGNNVVTVNAADARVLGVDRYEGKPSGDRLAQALAGLHYDEWGGLPFRLVNAAAGLATPLLYITGILLWWQTRQNRLQTRRKAGRTEPKPPTLPDKPSPSDRTEPAPATAPY